MSASDATPAEPLTLADLAACTSADVDTASAGLDSARAALDAAICVRDQVEDAQQIARMAREITDPRIRAALRAMFTD